MLQATGLPRVRHGSAPEQQLLLSLKLPPPHRLPSLPRPHHWSREGPWASPPGPPGPILWARPPCLHPHPQASLSLEDLPPHSPAPPPHSPPPPEASSPAISLGQIVPGLRNLPLASSDLLVQKEGSRPPPAVLGPMSHLPRPKPNWQVKPGQTGAGQRTPRVSKQAGDH